MALVRGQAALDLTGMVSAHAEAFAKVAYANDVVIMCRAVGKYATQLLEENYASKGYHNKAKSCNWGPMAGFVLDDPRFTKAGATAESRKGQSKALHKAQVWGATSVPVFISEARRQWLEKNGVVRRSYGDDNRFVYNASSPWGSPMKFVLRKEKPIGAKEDLWAIYYGKKETPDNQIEGDNRRVMAVRDPFCSLNAKDYRAATTGDYDLFAIFPPLKKQHGDLRRNVQIYDPTGIDDRAVPVSQTVQHSYAAFDASEFVGDNAARRAGLGNMTPRLIQIRSSLNRAIRRSGYSGGDLVHHSDEAGRPMVDDVDLPVIAFLPDPADLEPWGINNLADMKTILRRCKETHALILNPGWKKELGVEFF